jgi:Putative zinc-finger
VKRWSEPEHYHFVMVVMRGGIYPMDHEAVVRQKLTEQYLLNELSPQARDEFEEHYFDCQKCALDVQAGALFVEQSKIALAEEPVSAGLLVPPVPAPKPGWFAWLRPAFAAPVMALLLAVIGYQNLVTLPQTRQAQGRPQVFQSWAMVNVGTYAGENLPAVTPAPGKGFLLLVRIPPDGAFASFTADLYNPSGKLEWSLTLPAVAGQSEWPVQVPAANRETGTYDLKVRGVTAAGESKEIGEASFELKIQK